MSAKNLVIFGLVLLCLLASVSAGDARLPLTVTWNPVFASFYTGTLCLEETNLFGSFDNIIVEYTYNVHSASPPSPRIIYLIDQGNDRYCNNLQPTLWDLNVPTDTLSDARIKVRYGADVIFQDKKWSTDVSVIIDDSGHLFNGSGKTFNKTFNISLNKGWNLISIPLKPLNNSVEAVFSSIQYSDLFSYDSGWTIPTKINTALGYWINADNEYILTVRGSKPKSSLISVTEGWNLIGYPKEKNILEMANITKAYAYKSSKWYSYDSNKLLNNLNKFTPGFGYWVYEGEK